MPVLIGTSGWQYRDWRGAFYPAGLPQARWLEHHASRFRTLEVNNAFYRLPEASTFTAWAERTPDDFLIAVKASRYLTHIKRLKDPAEPVKRFVERASCLGLKLGPVLLQLPPNLAAKPDALDETLRLFPRGWRVAVEFRHETWFTDEVRALLQRQGAAMCLADSPHRRTPVCSEGVPPAEVVELGIERLRRVRDGRVPEAVAKELLLLIVHHRSAPRSSIRRATMLRWISALPP